VKVLTLNTWTDRGPWKERWEVIFHGLGEYQPDIVAFQEAFNEEWADHVREAAGYNYLLFPKEHSGLMFLSNWEILEHFHLKLPGSIMENYERYCLYILVKSPTSGHEYAIFNTHFSWKTPDTASRQAQAVDMIRFMDEKARLREKIALGDFNSVSESVEMKKFRDAGFRDTFREANPEDSGLTWDNHKNPYAASSSERMPDRRIDYIYLKNSRPTQIELKSTKLVFTQKIGDFFATDHFGLLTELEEVLNG